MPTLGTTHQQHKEYFRLFLGTTRKLLHPATQQCSYERPQNLVGSMLAKACPQSLSAGLFYAYELIQCTLRLEDMNALLRGSIVGCGGSSVTVRTGLTIASTRFTSNAQTAQTMEQSSRRITCSTPHYCGIRAGVYVSLVLEMRTNK